MLTDSERFAFTTRRHHAFASTGNAYDAVQCDEAIRTGVRVGARATVLGTPSGPVDPACVTLGRATSL